MLHFLYRKRSGQVLGASTDAAAYANVDSTYFGIATDPIAPDTDTQPPKVYEPLINTVRLATQPEIDGFALAEYQDRYQQERDLMLSEIDIEGDANTPHDIGNQTQRAQWRYVLRILNQAINQLNILRQRDRDRAADVAAATNLGDLKTRWAAHAPLNDLANVSKAEAKADYLQEWDKG